MNVKNPCIRFLRFHQRWYPGDIVKSLGYGVCDALVKRGVAEWHKPGKRNRESVRAVHSDGSYSSGG